MSELGELKTSRGFGVDRWGGQGGGISFGSANGLRAQVFVFLALGSVVARESTTKALSFTDAFGPLSGGKFGQSDGIDIHGVRVRGGSRGG